MAAASIVETTSVVSPKVVPLHGVQAKIADTAEMATVQGRKRKNPLPAAPLAKVSEPTLQEKYAALTLEQKKEVDEKLIQVMNTVKDVISQLHHVLSKGAGNDGRFDAFNCSILMLYTAFAESQMKQNGLVMNGWAAQQQAQNASLNEAAAAESKSAGQANDFKSNQVCWWKVLLAAVGVFVGAALAVTGVGALAGVSLGTEVLGGISSTTIFGVTAGLIAAGAGAGMYVSANNDPNADANWGLTSVQTDESLISNTSVVNQFWNTICQKANNVISMGSSTNLTQASSNDTQIGQQAAQIIQAMGQVMKLLLSR